jgi:gas vesicle protein
MKAVKFITSALILTAAGVAVGMLFAPQKGSRTRRKISELNHDYNDYLSDRFDEFVDFISHPLENAEDEAKRLAKKAKAKANKIAAKVN